MVAETVTWDRHGEAMATNHSFTLGSYVMGMKRPRHYHYPPHETRHRNRRRHRGASNGTALLGLGLVGAMAAAGWTMASPEQQAATLSAAKEVGVATGMMRERAPQEGDYWRGCDDARAAGTAPIYRGEPGYREGMDGDSDGIACEPYR